MRQFAKEDPMRLGDHWHLALQPHRRALPAANRAHLDASSSRRRAIAHHRLRQLLDSSAGPQPAASMNLPSAVAVRAPATWRIVHQLLVEAVVISCRALSSGKGRLTGLRGFPCCSLRTPFQPNPSSDSMLPFSRSLSRSRALRYPLRPCPRIASLASRYCRYAPWQADWRGRCARKASLEPFSSLRKSPLRFFSWPPRAPPSAAFSGSRRCR